VLLQPSHILGSLCIIIIIWLENIALIKKGFARTEMKWIFTS
jgi:hypothetical protein